MHKIEKRLDEWQKDVIKYVKNKDLFLLKHLLVLVKHLLL